MAIPKPTVEDLLIDADFIEYCLYQKNDPENKWYQYLINHPDEEVIFSEAESYIFLLTGKMPDAVIDSKLQSFKTLFYNRKTRETKVISMKPRLQKFSWIGIAASLLLVLAYSLFFLRGTPQVHSFEHIKGNTFETSSRHKKSIVLADGTEAIVYPGSKIVVSEDFNKRDRKIAVYGQVFLKIFHQKEKPFIAYSKHTTTTALGTAFYVRDFVNGDNSSVVLLNGQVKIEVPKTKSLNFLDPGGVFEINNKTKQTTKFELKKSDLDDLSGNKLRFVNADMKSIISKLEFFYGIQINLDRCDCQFKRITGDYSNHSLISILNTISYINKLNWELVDDQVTFIPMLTK